MTESDRLETIEQMIDEQRKTITEFRQTTEDRHEMITELTQLIEADQSGLDISLPSPEELSDQIETLEALLKDHQALRERQLVQIEKLRQSLKGMIGDADPREVTTIQELAARLYRIERAIEDHQTAIEEQLAQIETLKESIEE
jgi:chromosome segregation ATPase